MGEMPRTVAEAKITMKMTPETYSGVVVVTMAKPDRMRSVQEPSRIPDSTPRSSAVGTITIITQSISQEVMESERAITSDTGCLKTVE